MGVFEVSRFDNGDEARRQHEKSLRFTAPKAIARDEGGHLQDDTDDST